MSAAERPGVPKAELYAAYERVAEEQRAAERNLCACGCGEPTSGRFNAKTGEPIRFKLGHHNRSVPRDNAWVGRLKEKRGMCEAPTSRSGKPCGHAATVRVEGGAVWCAGHLYDATVKEKLYGKPAPIVVERLA